METLAKASLVCALAAGTYAAFKALEESASPASRATLSAWLRRTSLSKDHTAKLHEVLETTFVAVFGTNPFQLKFIARSLLLSAIAAPTSLALYYLLLRLTIADSAIVLSKQFETISDIAMNGAFILIVTILSDYLSLLKSSLIIQCAHFRQNTVKFYLVDLILSVFMAGGWLFFLASGTVIYSTIAERPHIPGEVASHASGVVSALLSALFPTVVALLYVLSTGLARFIVVIGRPLDVLRMRVLDVDSKPFQAVGILILPIVVLLSALVTALL